MNRATSGRRKSILHRIAAAALFSAVLFVGSSPGAVAAPDGARVVKYSKEDIIPVHAKLRFSTLIVLPDSEEILDFTSGDKEFWIINGAHNLCYVHPAQAGIRSNLNLITAAGHVYSFLLTEVSNDPSSTPDLKLFVEPKEGTGFTAELPLHGYVRATESEAYKKELDAVRAQTSEQIRAAQADATQQVSKFRTDYQSKLQFDYNVDAKALREPFLPRSERLVLDFPHDKHRAVNCIRCHHNFTDRSGDDSCISCHRSGRADIRVGVEAGFHDFCLGCHRDPPAYLTGQGPVTGCNTCHAPVSDAALRGL